MTERDQGWNVDTNDIDDNEVIESLLHVKSIVESFRAKLKEEICTLPASAALSDSTSTDASFESENDAKRLGNALKEVEECKKELAKLRKKEQLLEKEAMNLRQKLQKETEARRALLEELMELKGNIRVLVRVRPLKNVGLSPRKLTKSLEFVDGQSLTHLVQQKTFEFDACIDGESTNERVFNDHVSAMVQHALDGTNCTLIAYGQTGSGKTHTMLGTESDPGLARRVITMAFSKGHCEEGVISLSALQVYNETIQDLLAAGSRNLQVRQQTKGTGLFVRGLTSVPIRSLTEAEDVIQNAVRRRIAGSHSLNETSSRSHLVIFVNFKDASMALVDLAGSERLSKTEASGESLKESQHINWSLSALGDVLHALKDKRSSHVPFRNSKLTYLLKDALSGRSKVTFIACVSPEAESSSETFCTLSFVERIRTIELGPVTAASKSPATRKAM